MPTKIVEVDSLYFAPAHFGIYARIRTEPSARPRYFRIHSRGRTGRALQFWVRALSRRFGPLAEVTVNFNRDRLR